VGKDEEDGSKKQELQGSDQKETAKPLPASEPSRKKMPFARMFHPHNGREDFGPANPDEHSFADLLNATVSADLPGAVKLREFLKKQQHDT